MYKEKKKALFGHFLDAFYGACATVILKEINCILQFAAYPTFPIVHFWSLIQGANDKLVQALTLGRLYNSWCESRQRLGHGPTKQNLCHSQEVRVRELWQCYGQSFEVLWSRMGFLAQPNILLLGSLSRLLEWHMSCAQKSWVRPCCLVMNLVCLQSLSIAKKADFCLSDRTDHFPGQQWYRLSQKN